MANYALTVTPKFTPFTYDELVKPVEAYQKVYDAYNEKYDAIEDEISKYKSLEKSDPEAYARYADYVSKLQAEKDSIAAKGLSSATRKNFSDLRRQYAEQIVPMTEAETRQKELIKRYEEAKLKDPTLLTDIDPRTLKISDLMENPNASFESYSGKLLQSQMENQMSALATEIRDQPRKWNNASLIQHYGVSRDEVLAAFDTPYDPKSQKVINQIANSVLESSGILNWNTDDATKQQAYNWIMQGAMKGVGKDVVTEDFYAREAERRRTNEATGSSSSTITGFTVASAPAVASYLNSNSNTLPPSNSNYKVNESVYNALRDKMAYYGIQIDNAGKVKKWGTCPEESKNVISGMIASVITPVEQSSDNGGSVLY